MILASPVPELFVRVPELSGAPLGYDAVIVPIHPLIDTAVTVNVAPLFVYTAPAVGDVVTHDTTNTILDNAVLRTDDTS